MSKPVAAPSHTNNDTEYDRVIFTFDRVVASYIIILLHRRDVQFCKPYAAAVAPIECS